MIKNLVLALVLLCAGSAHAKLITAVWESPLNVQSNGVFSGAFTGFDHNDDDYLTYNELLSFNLVFSGDANSPGFTHHLENLVPDDNNPATNFLFTLSRHCDASGLNCDFPFGATDSGFPSILSVATSDSFLLGPTGYYQRTGNYATYSYGNDAWAYGLPHGASFRGSGAMSVTVPNPASGALFAFGLVLLVLRIRR